MLTERLEVKLDPELMRLLREEAQRRRLSLGELVRRSLEQALKDDRLARLEAADALFRVGAPVGDWASMEREIEAARIQGP